VGPAACYGENVKCIQYFGWGYKKERGHLEELGKEYRTTLGQDKGK
jgi:hypothetical protein